ncbi:transcriptional regulator [Candidimonas sp. SYP-B2681]|uniref:winged helix-turn-helix transcriptional regulator n=1 Tax=Candidimonas sp. SYP-B2681 TaxID=2497686 RepID=UPI000F88FAAE|nr:helix-turn-helix domain-containing protein [Candidimonas sp. SYP-B2681]RTZ45454.1 transcriptional regulator [Candidimonas sp. SYP-B2681]
MNDVQETLRRLQESAGTANAESSAIRNVLDNLGDKWSLLVGVVLAEKPHRFNELRRRLPDISQRMLTATLRNLTRDGITTRTVYPTRPPSVEYALTPEGYAFLNAVTPLVKWAVSHHAYILEARRRSDESQVQD